MTKIRFFQEEIAERYPNQQMKIPTHLYTGQEAVATGGCLSLKPTDQVTGYYRGHGYYLARGGDPKKFIAELYLKATGEHGGKAGSQHLTGVDVGYMASSAIVASPIPIATGMALALKMKGEKKVVMCFFGDGAVEEGVFFECLNFSALRKLPIVFICENNFYAAYPHISIRQARPNHIFELSKPFGIPSVKIDGNDVLKVYQAASHGVKRARQGLGPFFIEAETYRWHEHVGEKDDSLDGTRPKKDLQQWMKKDPIRRLEKFLFQKGVLSQIKKEKIISYVNQIINDAFEFAESSPLPDKSELLKDVYANKPYETN